jgi:hypothetical protein
VQTAIEDNQSLLAALRVRQQQLNQKLTTATMGRKFEEGGANSQFPSWYVNGNGKLERIH